MEMNNKISIGVLILAVVGIVIYLALSSGTGAVVSAVGQSQIEAMPDNAVTYINVEGKAESSKDAKAELDAINENLVVNLVLAGFNRNDLKTEDFRIYQEYTWDDSGNRKEGEFIATQRIVVETNDFDEVAEIVDAAINAGAQISWINFELSQERKNEIKAEALKLAAEDAKVKAESTASGLGKKLGKVVSVNTESYDYMPYEYFRATDSSGMEEAKSAALNISPRDVDVTATVRVSYELR